MTQPAKVQEPSMEEILASIRRIIADDEAKPPAADNKPAASAAPAPTPAPAPAKPEKPAAAAPPSKPAMADIPPSRIPAAVAAAEKKAAPPPPAPVPPRPAPAASASNSQDDIDALLNGLDEATSAEEIRPPPPAPEPEPEVFELTDDMAVPNAAPPQQASFQKVEPQDDLEFAESASRAINRPPAYEPPAFAPPPAAPAGPILSQTTVSAVESAFNTLAHTVLSNNARTLEDLVKEMLRPMLKSWLDDNLPGLVERIVKAEIERVSRGR
jgi:cell pole-organizing protein PopZ